MAILEIVRKVVEQETVPLRTSALGVVSTVFVHSDADDYNNYEINVRLKHEDLELRRVPMMVSHDGFAAPPLVGDVVLVQFVNGDLNQPVVAGRFYHADNRPPLHRENDILFEQRVSDGTLNHLRFTSDGSIILQRDVQKPEDNSQAKTGIKIDGASGDVEIKAGDKVVIVLKNGSEIQITADGNPINVKCDSLTLDGKMTVKGNVEIDGDLAVSGAGGKTTISGNTITGG
jgi:phage baseplate assembly protein gpV